MMCLAVFLGMLRSVYGTIFIWVSKVVELYCLMSFKLLGGTTCFFVTLGTPRSSIQLREDELYPLLVHYKEPGRCIVKICVADDGYSTIKTEVGQATLEAITNAPVRFRISYEWPPSRDTSSNRSKM